MHEDREDAAAAVLTDLAELIAAAAPRGWKRAELHGYALGEGSSGHRGFSFLPDNLNEYGANDIDVHPGLCALHTLLRATEHLTIDLELDARGRFRAILSERLDRTDGRGFRYLLDPQAEPPEVGVPASTLAEAGDPAEAVALLNEYHQLLHAVLDLPDLPPPLEEWDLDFALPRDLSAYAVADGGGGQVQFHGFAWFGLEMLEELSSDHWWVTRGWRRFVHNSFVTEFGPPGAIRRVGDHPGWIPFATDTFGDYLAVDMAPGPNGRPGQVILIGRHQDAGPIYVAESVTELIRSHADALRTDRIDLSGLHGHPTVGRVVLRSEKPVDLRPLASCPNLHTLDLTDSPAADVSALGQLTNLRYLRMLRPQWQEFLAAQPLPASLAVAELAEEPLKERKFYWSFDKAYEKTRRPTTADALEWAENLTCQPTDIVTIKGKFKR